MHQTITSVRIIFPHLHPCSLIYRSIAWDGGIITFGEIFDLPHLRAALHKPVLEWKDLKQLPLSTSSKPFDTSEVEEIGCWSTRKEADPHPIPARMFIRHLGLDPSYTRVPGSTRKSQDKNDDHVVFASLAALVYPPTTEGQQKSSFSLPASGYPVLEAGRLSSHKRSPEDKLTCFDFLYYATSGAESFEWNYPWSPAWNQVGRHVRFNWWMVERSEGYLRRAFGLDKDQAIPPVSEGFTCTASSRSSECDRDVRPTLTISVNATVYCNSYTTW